MLPAATPATAIPTTADATTADAARHIVFAHANGFPAGVYRKLFDRWRSAGWTVSAIEKVGHDPAHPVTQNWPHLAQELVRFIDRQVAGPVFLVGHSLGGYLSVLAAAQRPEFARGVVLLDSPLVGGWKAKVLQTAQTLGIGERFSPGAISKRRRQHWPSAEAAYEHFASKAAFARWDPDVLRDYIEAGTQVQGEQRTLSFHRDVETAIYNTLPHHMARVLRTHPLRCPVAFIGGTTSTEIHQAGMKTTERLVRQRLRWIEGSHLYPMERPLETADAVLAELDSMATAAETRT